MNLLESRREGEIEGERRGRIEGRVEGEEKLATLMNLLYREHRFEDIGRVASDKQYKEKLYKEYNIQYYFIVMVKMSNHFHSPPFYAFVIGSIK